MSVAESTVTLSTREEYQRSKAFRDDSDTALSVEFLDLQKRSGLLKDESEMGEWASPLTILVHFMIFLIMKS